jgi:transposase
VLVVTVCGMAYPSDLNDDQWALLEPVFNSPGKRGRKHGDDLRTVVDAMLYIAQTGCQWRYRLAKSFENTTISATGWLQTACIATTLRHLSQDRPRQCGGPVAA